MVKVGRKYGEGTGRHFTARATAESRKMLAGNGLTQKEFADKHDVNLAVLRDVLYGRSPAERGTCHRAAVALGLKKEILSVTDSGASRNLSRSVAPASILDEVFGPDPSAIDKAKIAVLRSHPAAVITAVPTCVPPDFNFAAFARRHGWHAATVRQTAHRYVGSTTHPAYHTKA